MVKKMSTSDGGGFAVSDHDQEFDPVVSFLQHSFRDRVADATTRLFTTSTAGLWNVYLNNLPGDEADRQYHTCNCCRRFIERFGGLVTIDDTGKTTSAVWDLEIPGQYYVMAVAAMKAHVEKQKVDGVFYHDEKLWGVPKGPGTGPHGVWTHFALTPPAHLISKSKTHTPYQLEAEKQQDYIGMISASNEYPENVLNIAVQLLQTDALYRSEKVLGIAEWFRDLQAMRNAEKDAKKRSHLLWRAIAYAPPGFAHPKSSMVGTLLDDIKAGFGYEDVRKRFAAKMHPLQYQRPTAAPTGGAIAAAEKVFEQLGLAPALERRFARLNEIQTLWRPQTAKTKTSGGVFGHLQTKDSAPSAGGMKVPEHTMTWRKFVESVLPFAESIQLRTPMGKAAFGAYLTAQYDDAPPIVQWDFEDRRNPFTHYVYHGGSSAHNWGLKAGEWTRVDAVSADPSHWYGNTNTHQSEGVLFVLHGARDSQYHGAGNALFPETLKAEVHGVRSVIEAYSKKAVIHGGEDANVCGLLLQKSMQTVGYQLRVVSKGVTSDYRIDRWE